MKTACDTRLFCLLYTVSVTLLFLSVTTSYLEPSVLKSRSIIVPLFKFTNSDVTLYSSSIVCVVTPFLSVTLAFIVPSEG